MDTCSPVCVFIRLSGIIQQLVACCLLILATNAHATAQIPDVIIINGESESLYTNPLDRYLQANPGVLPEPEVISSANWRGYVASWRITDDVLLLEKVDMEFDISGPSDQRMTTETRNMISMLFPDVDRVVADWYTGALIIPQGDVVEYVHMGYGSLFEHYILLIIDHGRVRRTMELDAEKFQQYRQQRFAEYKNTAGYAEKVQRMKSENPSYDDALIESFLFDFDAEYYLSIE